MILILLLSVAALVSSQESNHLIQVYQHFDLTTLQSFETDFFNAMVAVFPQVDASKLSVDIYNVMVPATTNIEWTYSEPWPTLVFDDLLLAELYTVPNLENLLVGAGEYKSQMIFTYCNAKTEAAIDNCDEQMAVFAATQLNVSPDLVYSSWMVDENGCVVILLEITDPSVVIDDESALMAAIGVEMESSYSCNVDLGLATDWTAELDGWISVTGETLEYFTQHENELIQAMSQFSGLSSSLISIHIGGEGDDASITWVLKGITTEPEDVIEDIYCRMLEVMGDLNSIYMDWDCIGDDDCVGEWKSCNKNQCSTTYKVTTAQSGSGAYCPYQKGQLRYCQPHETDKPENCPTECNPLWVDSHGDTCQEYKDNEWCTMYQTTGSGWSKNWGNLFSLTNEGSSAMVCPQCGCSYWVLNYDLEAACPYEQSVQLTGGVSWDQMNFYDCYSEEEFLEACSEALNVINGDEQPISCTSVAPGTGNCLQDIFVTITAPNPFKASAGIGSFYNTSVNIGKFGNYMYKDSTQCPSEGVPITVASGPTENCPTTPEVVSGSGGTQTIELTGGTSFQDFCNGASEKVALVIAINDGVGTGVGVADIFSKTDMCGNEIVTVVFEGDASAVTNAITDMKSSGLSTSEGDYTVMNEQCIPPYDNPVIFVPPPETYTLDLCFCDPTKQPPIVCPYNHEICDMGCFCAEDEYTELLCAEGDMFNYPNFPCGNGNGRIPTPVEFEYTVYPSGECEGEPFDVDVAVDAEGNSFNPQLETIALGGMCVLTYGTNEKRYQYSYRTTCDLATNSIVLEYFQTPDCSGGIMFEMTSATTAEGGNCNTHPVNGAGYKFIFDGTCPESTTYTEEMTFNGELPLDPSIAKEAYANANFFYCQEESILNPYSLEEKDKSCSNNEIYTCSPPSTVTGFEEVCNSPGYAVPNMAVSFYSYEFDTSACGAAERRMLQEAEAGPFIELGVCVGVDGETYSYIVNCGPGGDNLIVDYYNGYECSGFVTVQIGSVALADIMYCQLNAATQSYGYIVWEGTCSQKCTSHDGCSASMYCNDSGECEELSKCDELDDPVDNKCPTPPIDCLEVIYGIAEEDVCGVCQGDGTSCLDCEGTPNGNAVCETDCFGVEGGDAVEDECGVCDGDNSSCTDCDGVPNGPSILECNDPTTTTLDPCPTCEVCPIVCGPFTYSVDIQCGHSEANCHEQDIKEAIVYGLDLNQEDVTVLSTVAAFDDSHVTVTFEIPCQQELDLGAFNAMYQEYLAAVPELNEVLGTGYSQTVSFSTSSTDVTACSATLTSVMGDVLGYAGDINMKIIDTSAGADAIFGFAMTTETKLIDMDDFSQSFYDDMVASSECDTVVDSMMVMFEEVLAGASLSHVSGQETALASCMDDALSNIVSIPVVGSASVAAIAGVDSNVVVDFYLPAEDGIYEALASPTILSNAFVDCVRDISTLSPFVSYSYTVDIYGATEYILENLQGTLSSAMQDALGVDMGVTVESVKNFDYGASVTYGLDATTFALTTSDAWIASYCTSLNTYGIHYFKSFQFRNTLAYCTAYTDTDYGTVSSYADTLKSSMATVLGVDDVSLSVAELYETTGLFYSWPYSLATSVMQTDGGALYKAIDNAILTSLFGVESQSSYTDICGVENGDRDSCETEFTSISAKQIPAGDNCEQLIAYDDTDNMGKGGCKQLCIDYGGECNGCELNKQGTVDNPQCRLYGPQCTTTVSSNTVKNKGAILIPVN